MHCRKPASFHHDLAVLSVRKRQSAANRLQMKSDAHSGKQTSEAAVPRGRRCSEPSSAVSPLKANEGGSEFSRPISMLGRRRGIVPDAAETRDHGNI